MKTYKNIINIQIQKNIKFPFNKKWVGNIIKTALNKEEVTGIVEIDCLITDDSFIRILNNNHRGIDNPTDVLSFAFSDQTKAPDSIVFPQGPDTTINLGSIIVSYERAVEQAQKQMHSIQEELTLLLVHGVLHLLGYDHVNQSDSRKMRSREKVIIKSIEDKVK